MYRYKARKNASRASSPLPGISSLIPDSRYKASEPASQASQASEASRFRAVPIPIPNSDNQASMEAPIPVAQPPMAAQVPLPAVAPTASLPGPSVSPSPPAAALSAGSAGAGSLLYKVLFMGFLVAAGYLIWCKWSNQQAAMGAQAQSGAMPPGAGSGPVPPPPNDGYQYNWDPQYGQWVRSDVIQDAYYGDPNGSQPPYAAGPSHSNAAQIAHEAAMSGKQPMVMNPMDRHGTNQQALDQGHAAAMQAEQGNPAVYGNQTGQAGPQGPAPAKHLPFLTGLNRK